MSNNEIAIRPETIVRWLFAAGAVLVLAGIVSYLMLWWLPQENWLRHVARLFELNEERTFPTFFSVGQLLLASAVTGVVACRQWIERDPFRRQWLLLALLMLLLAIDEQVGLHERLTRPMRLLLGGGAGGGEALGVFFYAWVIPGALIVAGVALAFARFLFALPSPTRDRLFLSGVVFVGGALGMELLGGKFYEAEGFASVGLMVVSTSEEAMEMFGITLFIRAVLLHAVSRQGALGFALVADAPARAAAPWEAAGETALPPAGAAARMGRAR